MVQPSLHELEVRMQCQLALDFQSHDVSSEKILARGAEMLAEAQHGGQNQDTGVADLDAAIVVVQRVGNGAIRESRVGNRKL